MQGTFLSHPQIAGHFVKIRQFGSPVRCRSFLGEYLITGNFRDGGKITCFLKEVPNSKNRARYQKNFYLLISGR
jgi:hypothetical protein